MKISANHGHQIKKIKMLTFILIIVMMLIKQTLYMNEIVIFSFGSYDLESFENIYDLSRHLMDFFFFLILMKNPF